MLLPKIDVLLVASRHKQHLSPTSIADYSRRQVEAFLSDETPECVGAFIEHLLAKWLILNASSLTSKRVRSVYKKLHVPIGDKLAHDLELIDARAFSLIRHIKALDVATPLGKGEVVSMKFTPAKLYHYAGTLTRFMSEGELLISNHRLLLTPLNESKVITAFSWPEVNALNYVPEGVAFAWRGEYYLLAINDAQVFHQTMRNYLARKLKEKSPRVN